MAYMLFTKAILNQEPINIYGDGTTKRDYTYVADVVTAIEKIIDYLLKNQCNNEIFNIGNSNPISLLELIEKLENHLEINAIKNFLPARTEEIETTFADCSKLEKCIGYKPNTPIDKGLDEFAKWHKEYFNETLKFVVL
jgi:UDP-glucuronate 4-epimerase